jgi:predicted permease
LLTFEITHRMFLLSTLDTMPPKRLDLLKVTHDLRLRLRALLRRETVEREMTEEMAFHLEMQTRKHIAAGCDPVEAQARARREFGNVELAKEDARDARRVSLLETLAKDIRFALRLLRRSPGYAIVSIVAIGLAIGINSAFFTLVDAFVWRPIPVPHSDQLVKIALRYRRGRSILVSYPQARAIATHGTSVGDVIFKARCAALAFRASSRTTAAPAAPGCVSGNYLSALGATALLGRSLNPNDDDVGATPTIVISDYFWTRVFARAPDVIGHDVIINGTHATVVGVIARSFVGTVPIVPDFWMTISLAARVGAIPGTLDDPENRVIDLRARLRPGVTLARAEAEMSGLVAEPGGHDRPGAQQVVGAVLTPNGSMLVATWQTTLVLAPALLVVALVLIIACANLATLSLSRALARQREIAIRLAMGASRGRLVRQLLTEGLVIALAGAALGLVLSRWTIAVVARSFFAWIRSSFGTVALNLSPSWRVVAYTIGLAGLAVVTFGLVPALQVTSQSLTSSLKGEDRALGTRIRRSRFRDTLVAVQVAASFVLLVASATLIASLRGLGSTPLGLDTSQVGVATFGLSAQGQVPAPLAAARDTFAVRVAALRGVQATARALFPPLTSWFPLLSVAPATDQPSYRHVQYNVVTPGYFALLEQRVVAGRAFSNSDTAGGANVAIVTRAAARALWPTSSAVDKRLRVASAHEEPDRLVRVIGIVADAHSGSLWDDDSDGYVYFPASAHDLSQNVMPLLVRASGSLTSATRDIEDVARRIDPNTPVTVEPMVAERETTLMPIRYGTWITTAVGAFGLGLALIGLYGIVAFAVLQRRRDLAIHVAMGALPRDVMRLVLARELRLVAVGLAAGLLLSTIEARLIAAWVIPLASLGPMAFLALGALLFTIALGATVIPARAALRVAPMLVLRQD